jgi:hypothetical protein
MTLTLLAFTSLLVAQLSAQAGQPEIKPGDIKRTQEESKKLYSRLMTDILKLALKWEKSDSSEDRERAKTLRAVLKMAEEKGLDTLFKQLVEGLDNKNANTGDIQSLLGKDEKLIAALLEILKTLETEDEAAMIRQKILELKEIIKEVERIKREQENLRARTENPRGDAEKIAKEQNNLAKQTQDVADKLGGKDPKKNAGDNSNPGGKDDKSEPKPESKPGEAAPEAKPDTQENKSESKAAGNNSTSPMPPGPMGEPKPSPPGGMEGGSTKPSPKEGPMASGDPKGGEPKPMGGNPMGGSPMDPKSAESKPMSGDSKAQGDGKGDMKPAGQPGGEGKPMSGAPMPPAGGKAGQPGTSKPASGSPSAGQPSESPPNGAAPKPTDQAQENIQQAVPQQQGAEQDLKKNDRQNATQKEEKAIENLEKALQELEKRLKQLREKELAKLLGNLEERVNRMLRMQQEVYEATRTIDKIVKKNGQKTTAEIQKSQVESDRELVIIAEAEKALKLMEGEGSAVVFAGVLNQVKGDMEAVQKRLNEGRVDGRNKTDLAEGTQLIEEDIIEQLIMMKEALKKAKQDLENQQNKPPGEPNDNKSNQRLINLINELKLIKSLQEQVNKRTTSYSKQDPGEQAKDLLIQGELKQLSDRQRVLQEMLHKIATEANQ